MSKILLPIFCLVLASGLVFYLGGAVLNGSDNPTIQSILLNGSNMGLKDLNAKASQLNQALKNANDLTAKINNLQEAEKNISKEDQDKLAEFIPDGINNINFIIDINNIASKHGMILKGVRVKDEGVSDSVKDMTAEQVAAAKAASSNKIAETYLSFSVAGTYDSLLGFLSDLSSSLRVADITSLAFSVDEKGLNQYNIELKTYWIK